MSAFKTKISRELAAKYGRQAVQITDSGEYIAPSGRPVDISRWVKRSIDGTVSYSPGQSFQESATGNYRTKIAVENETTLEAARRLLDQGCLPVVLNFASATHPGGGFLGGARAQEEYLARSSGLYACIRSNAMYAYHRSRRDPLYTNYAIYSPEVPVFRSDDGSLLEEPYPLGIITSPAANAVKMISARRPEIGPAMWFRILKVLYIGLKHGHDSIVLGAWGCGAFGNEGHEIAALFRKAFDQNFKGVYRQVIFAIVDWSRERRFIGPFQEVFKAICDRKASAPRQEPARR
jgi:uncharacterized protein (TIGR02452 family)